MRIKLLVWIKLVREVLVCMSLFLMCVIVFEDCRVIEKSGKVGEVEL